MRPAEQDSELFAVFFCHGIIGIKLKSHQKSQSHRQFHDRSLYLLKQNTVSQHTYIYNLAVSLLIILQLPPGLQRLRAITVIYGFKFEAYAS